MSTGSDTSAFKIRLLLDGIAPFSWDLGFSPAVISLFGLLRASQHGNITAPSTSLQRPTNIFFPGYNQRPLAFSSLLTPPPYQNKHRQCLLNHIPSTRLDRLLKLLLEGSTLHLPFTEEEYLRPYMLSSMQTSSDVEPSTLSAALPSLY